MKTVMKAVALLFLIVILLTGAVSAEDYQLGSGDTLSISVYGYDELKVKELIIRSDGKISFPLVGEVQAAGISPFRLSDILTAALSEYVKNPRVTVNVDKPRTTRIYVLGEVVKPGMYEIANQHNLLDAIGASGGYTQKAAKKKVLVIRKDKPGKPISLNLLKLLERGDMTQNLVLSDGDVVYLTGNKKLDFARDIMPYITSFYQLDEMKKDK